MLPVIILCVVPIYILVKYITKHDIAATIGTLVYSFNTYMLLRQTDQLNITICMLLFPLLFFFFIKSLDEKKGYLSMSAAWVGVIISIFDFRLSYVCVGISFLYLIYSSVFSPKSQIIFKTLSFLLIVLLPLLVNTYWLLPLLRLNLISNNELFSRGLFGDSYMNIRQAITLFHPFWTGKEPSVFILQVTPWYMFFIPILAFAGWYMNRKDKHILFFAIVACLGIFLTKQSAEPFGAVYKFLYDRLPGFNAFREASKFYFLIALGYSVLISGFFNKLNQMKAITPVVNKVLFILIALLFVINTKPFLTGEIGTLYVPRTVHSDYNIWDNLIKSDKEFSRSLWVPTDTRWASYNNVHPKLGLASLIEYDGWSRYLTNKDINFYLSQKQLLSILTSNYSNNLLDNTSFKYIIIPPETATENIFKTYGSRGSYIDSLDKLPYLHRINAHTSEMVIYENKLFNQHIFATYTPLKLASSEPVRLRYTYVNPTEYLITIPKTDKQLYIHFTDTYNPGWRLSIPTTHVQSELHSNTFKLQESTSQQTLRLYFEPQKLVYIGSFISLTAILFSVIAFIFLKRNNI